MEDPQERQLILPMLPANQPSLPGLVVSCTCMFCYPQINDSYYELQRLAPHPPMKKPFQTLVNQKEKKLIASQKHMSGAKKKKIAPYAGSIYTTGLHTKTYFSL